MRHCTVEHSFFLAFIFACCPLDLGWSNFSVAASVCSNENERAKCCRLINAFIAVSVARYANSTGKLGVPAAFSEICLLSISETLQLYGIPSNAMVFCGLGTKILVSYPCEGRATVLEMLQSPNFSNVSENCKPPLSMESSCRKCVNSGIIYLRHLNGVRDNVTLSTCRNAAFVTLVNQGDSTSTIGIASCFFSVQGFNVQSGLSLQPPTPVASPSPPLAESPSRNVTAVVSKERHQLYHLKLIPTICIGIAAMAILLLVVMILLIRRKSRELKGSKAPSGLLLGMHSSNCPPPMFQRFTRKETKKATNNFTSEIGKGGFGTVYKAEFSNGLVVAVKRMHKSLEQGESDFYREMELLGRLHHRHLVSLKGFCTTRHERFLMYEYMENGSLRDHLHSSGKAPSWQRRIQIAIDVANALEYLHFYCDPPLCHRDIKPSNILLDANFRAKVADFGLADVSRGSSTGFDQVHADVHGTPGYVDPEYVVTRELTEKSDVYSYGVLLLELVSGRHAVEGNQNLVEWSRQRTAVAAGLPELVDPALGDSFDLEELQVVAAVAEWCTRSEGKARPSIKQVLVALYEGLDPVHRDFAGAVEGGGRSAAGGQGGKAAGGRSEVIPYSGDGRCLQSSSSTSRSYCSRSLLLESGGSPQSPPCGFSL
ncbi:unnamed protein product [Spirodela intermedia]|uniref:Protein kinase domain-containing protein n=1 Tax=Spirodela intermedia TaxID=51605 RepID=A0A7I8J0Y0_SPIIN|nr:unnamed protein product [Spirodela intermedia]CAA6663798.1 unnamed protein product [Spirodela intermedia]